MFHRNNEGASSFDDQMYSPMCESRGVQRQLLMIETNGHTT